MDAFASMDKGKAYLRSGDSTQSLLRLPPLPHGKAPIDMLRL